jgi:hypothetical protein
MSDGGKGSARRPPSVPLEQFDAAFEMIFKARLLCGLCGKSKKGCGCVPTDDGPGQVQENTEGEES